MSLSSFSTAGPSQENTVSLLLHVLFDTVMRRGAEEQVSRILPTQLTSPNSLVAWVIYSAVLDKENLKEYGKLWHQLGEDVDVDAR